MLHPYLPVNGLVLEKGGRPVTGPLLPCRLGKMITLGFSCPYFTQLPTSPPCISMTLNLSVVVVIAITVATVIAIIVPAIITTTIIVTVITLIIVPSLVVTTSMVMIVISPVPLSVIPVRAAPSQQDGAGNGHDQDYCAIHMNVLNVGSMEGSWLLETFVRAVFRHSYDHSVTQ